MSSLIFFIDKYGQVTEQPQRWSLFAPNISDQACFLACELRWDDMEETILLLSDNEPVDTAAYFRLGGNRLRSIEQSLAVGFVWYKGESQHDAQLRWREQIEQQLIRQYDILIAWVSLRVEAFLEQHEGAPWPTEIVVHVRGYEIAPPGASDEDGLTRPSSVPLARWVPTAEYPDDCLPLEAYDPVNNEFVLHRWSKETEQ